MRILPKGSRSPSACCRTGRRNSSSTRSSSSQGSAVVRVTVGGDVSNVVPRVDVTALRASARHDLVPFPIRIARGALTYTTPSLSVQGLDGAIGESTFTGVSARLGMKAPYVLSAQQGSAVAALGQLFHWAATQPQFSKQLAGVKQVSGTLAVSIAQVGRSPEHARAS